MILKKCIVLTLALVLVTGVFASCGNNENKSHAGESATEFSSQAQRVETPASALESKVSNAKILARVGVIKGPSGLGMLGLMEKASEKQAENIYEFTVESAPQDIQSKLINGEVDIAAVPTNLASVLYNKTDKNISVIAVSTLGVLYMLTNEEEINAFSDLDGKTVYATGQASIPEYVLDYLIEQNNLKGKVAVEYKSEHSELATAMAAGSVQIAMLPQPFVTTVTEKNPDIKIALDLNEEWRKASGGTELTMTCIVVRNKYLENSKAAVDKFLDEYKQSTEFVNANVEEAAALSEKFNIIPEAVAKKAIPKCGIVYIDGDDMRTSVDPLLEIIMTANPQSVGGTLPDDAFYYKR